VKLLKLTLNLFVFSIDAFLSISMIKAQGNYIYGQDTIYKFVIEADSIYNIHQNNADTIATVSIRWFNNPDSLAFAFIAYNKNPPFDSTTIDFFSPQNNPIHLSYGNGKTVVKLPRIGYSAGAAEYRFRIEYVGPFIGGFWTKKIFYFSTKGIPNIIRNPPEIISAHIGDTVRISIRAIGGGESFQWQRNCNSGHKDIVGETKNMLILNNVNPVDACYYRCVVTNSFGEANSTSTSIVIKK
jgi:hypothetical protein